MTSVAGVLESFFFFCCIFLLCLMLIISIFFLMYVWVFWIEYELLL